MMALEAGAPLSRIRRIRPAKAEPLLAQQTGTICLPRTRQRLDEPEGADVKRARRSVQPVCGSPFNMTKSLIYMHD
jgi:hypothetical protein